MSRITYTSHFLRMGMASHCADVGIRVSKSNLRMLEIRCIQKYIRPVNIVLRDQNITQVTELVFCHSVSETCIFFYWVTTLLPSVV